MTNTDHGEGYRPLTIAELAGLLRGADEDLRWRLIAEFLEEYRWEPVEHHAGLLDGEPDPTGDEHWDVFLAALSEHLSAKDGLGAPAWSWSRTVLVPLQHPCGEGRRDSTFASSIPQPGYIRIRPRTGGGVNDPLLDRTAITDAFRRLGDRLARRGVVADLYVFGGDSRFEDVGFPR